MNFSSILQAVSQGWDFVWPPCVLLLVLVALLRILAPLTYKDFVALLQRLSERQRTFVAILRLYGLRRLLPAIDAFLIIFVLYLVQHLAPAIGNALPGHLVYDDESMWVSLSDQGSLVCALAAMPGANLDTLEQEIKVKERTMQSKLGAAGNVQIFDNGYSDRRFSATLQAFNLCKALILYLLLLAGYEAIRKKKRARTLGYLFPILVLLTVTAAFFVEKHVYVWEQGRYALLNDARILANLDGVSCEKITPERRDDIYRMLLLARRDLKKSPSWRVEFIDYYFTWLRRHLLPQRRNGDSYKMYLQPQLRGSLFSQDAESGFTAQTAEALRERYPKGSGTPLDPALRGTLELDYILPKMVDRDQLDAGSILYFTKQGEALHFFAGPSYLMPEFRELFSSPTGPQSALCPAAFRAEVEQFDTSTLLQSDDLALIREIPNTLIVTERLSCRPDDSAHGQPFTLGYKVSRIE